MATTRKSKAALFHNDGNSEQKQSGASKREQFIDTDERRNQHQPVVSNSLRIKLDHLKSFSALTDNQKIFFDAYGRGDYFIGLFGSAGVGKTFCAAYKALEEVLSKDNPFKQVVFVRSAVQTRDQGHVPGTLEEKESIFTLPYLEICSTLFGRVDAWDRLKEAGHVRFISTTAIRGISIDDSIIIVDEAQSMSYHEIDSVITRCGNRSKIIFAGDYRRQNDLNKNRHDVTGLPDFLKIARNMKDYTEINFTTDDIVRSSLVRDWIVSSEEMGY